MLNCTYCGILTDNCLITPQANPEDDLVMCFMCAVAQKKAKLYQNGVEWLPPTPEPKEEVPKEEPTGRFVDLS